MTTHSHLKPEFTEYGLTQWFWIARHRENLVLGKNTQIGCFTVLGCEHGIVVEDNVKIGYNCTVMSHSTIDGRKGKVTLKKGCRIGAGAIIFPGITVGENSIVGANSLVNHDIPPNQVWVGSPAKFLRRIKSDDFEFYNIALYGSRSVK